MQAGRRRVAGLPTRCNRPPTRCNRPPTRRQRAASAPPARRHQTLHFIFFSSAFDLLSTHAEADGAPSTPNRAPTLLPCRARAENSLESIPQAWRLPSGILRFLLTPMRCRMAASYMWLPQKRPAGRAFFFIFGRSELWVISRLHAPENATLAQSLTASTEYALAN